MTQPRNDEMYVFKSLIALILEEEAEQNSE